MFSTLKQQKKQLPPPTWTTRTEWTGPAWLASKPPKPAPRPYDYWSEMTDEDRAYARTPPTKRFPRCVPGTWRYDAWDPAELVMPFGKHSGKTLGEIAATPKGRSYLRWVVTNKAGDDDLRAAVLAVLGDSAPYTSSSMVGADEGDPL